MIASGSDLTLLRCVGYDVQIKECSAFLAEPWTHLLIVRHSSDNYGAIMVTPVVGDSEDDWSQFMSALLDAVPDDLAALGSLVNWIGGYHEPDELIEIRQRKEKAIMDQKFDLAADLRDRERKLMRRGY